jgi:hypothetical protein
MSADTTYGVAVTFGPVGASPPASRPSPLWRATTPVPAHRYAGHDSRRGRALGGTYASDFTYYPNGALRLSSMPSVTGRGSAGGAAQLRVRHLGNPQLLAGPGSDVNGTDCGPYGDRGTFDEVSALSGHGLSDGFSIGEVHRVGSGAGDVADPGAVVSVVGLSGGSQMTTTDADRMTSVPPAPRPG